MIEMVLVEKLDYVCPECGEQAVITHDKTTRTAEFRCNSCGHRADLTPHEVKILRRERVLR